MVLVSFEGIIGNEGLENAREEDIVIQSQMKRGEIVKIDGKFYWTEKCVKWVERNAAQLHNML